MTGIVSVRSGTWLNITTGADNALNGQLQQRPNQVSDDVYGAKTLNSYLNRAAFASPAPGTFGNLEYRAVEGPGYWTIDTGLVEADRLGGTRNIELRLESFNLTNHFNWGHPATEPAVSRSSAASRPTAARQRIMQFGVMTASRFEALTTSEADRQVGLTKRHEGSGFRALRARTAPSRRTRAFCSRALLPRGPSCSTPRRPERRAAIHSDWCPARESRTESHRRQEVAYWSRCAAVAIPRPERTVPSKLAACSTALTTVVPIAITRPSLRFVLSMSAAVAGCNFVRLIERQQCVEVARRLLTKSRRHG